MDIAASHFMAALTVTTGLSAPYNNLAIIYKQQVLVYLITSFCQFVPVTYLHVLFNIDASSLSFCMQNIFNLENDYISSLFQGNYANAIACYNEVLRVDPLAVDGLVNRGNTLKEAGRISEAIQDYFRAAAIRPTMAEAHANLAYAYKDV